LINFERKKKVKKNYSKRETEPEIKDSSSNIATNSNIKGSLFGFLKEETSMEKEHEPLEERNKMEMERSAFPQISDFSNNEEFEDFNNILNLKDSSKGKKSGIC